MFLGALTDSNGTSLQAYIDNLVEKAGEHDIQITMILTKKPDHMHIISRVAPERLPAAISALARDLRRKDKRKA